MDRRRNPDVTSAQTAILFEHSRARFVLWTGHCCLIHDPIAARLGPGIGTLLWPTGALRVIGTTLTVITEAPTG